MSTDTKVEILKDFLLLLSGGVVGFLYSKYVDKSCRQCSKSCRNISRHNLNNKSRCEFNMNNIDKRLCQIEESNEKNREAIKCLTDRLEMLTASQSKTPELITPSVSDVADSIQNTNSVNSDRNNSCPPQHYTNLLDDDTMNQIDTHPVVIMAMHNNVGC